MNLNLFKSRLFSFLVVCLFFIGFQNTLDAQARVYNFTGCDINAFIGQNDASTINPCDPCAANPPTSTFIANGQFADIYGQDVCYEEAGWVGWQLTAAPGAGFGLSPNPGLPACVPNLPGPLCATFTGTNAFWSGGGGPGYVTIFILP